MLVCVQNVGLCFCPRWCLVMSCIGVLYSMGCDTNPPLLELPPHLCNTPSLHLCETPPSYRSQVGLRCEG